MHNVTDQLLPLEYKLIIFLLFKVDNVLDAFVFENKKTVTVKTNDSLVGDLPLQ